MASLRHQKSVIFENILYQWQKYAVHVNCLEAGGRSEKGGRQVEVAAIDLSEATPTLLSASQSSDVYYPDSCERQADRLSFCPPSFRLFAKGARVDGKDSTVRETAISSSPPESCLTSKRETKVDEVRNGILVFYPTPATKGRITKQPVL